MGPDGSRRLLAQAMGAAVRWTLLVCLFTALPPPSAWAAPSDLHLNPQMSSASSSSSSSSRDPSALDSSRPAEDGGSASSYPDYKEMGVQYDEYPVVVPKRAAMLLDRIMVALQKAVDEDSGRAVKTRIPIEDTMDLQRRGQQKGGRIYWRCYFNAVTCF